MPQATSELQALWGTSDKKALDQILPNFTISKDGIIRPKLNYVQTDTDLSAIDFLFQEWDYGYEPLAVDDSPIDSATNQRISLFLFEENIPSED